MNLCLAALNVQVIKPSVCYTSSNTLVSKVKVSLGPTALQPYRSVFRTDVFAR